LSVPLSHRFKHCLSNFRSATKYDIFIYFMLVCLQRNVYCIENKFHFLFVCPVYADIRKRHVIDGWLRNYVSEHLFVQIITDTNIQYIFALARYLDAAFKLKDSLL